MYVRWFDQTVGYVTVTMTADPNQDIKITSSRAVSDEEVTKALARKVFDLMSDAANYSLTS